LTEEALTETTTLSSFAAIKRLYITLNWIGCAVDLYSLPMTFRKVVRQQIWGEVTSADLFVNLIAKKKNIVQRLLRLS